jgi:lipopolysaccharide/colanic/teichoic acid biosynthesis glycosyltransferase
MLKRLIDIIFSLIGLLIISPVFIVFIIAIWMNDFHNPFYVAHRVGRNGKLFKMIKLRSMKIDADKSGIASTSNEDDRITAVGHIIRKFKFDELSQLLNVFIGDMSLVGPRPQVEQDVKLYTEKEMGLLKIRPGITDFSSIVFSDEGNILKGSANPNLDYNQLIRPWKSRLGLFYINNRTFLLDIKLVYITILSIVSYNKALRRINVILNNLSSPEKLIEICRRHDDLIPYPPPGSDSIETLCKY